MKSLIILLLLTTSVFGQASEKASKSKSPKTLEQAIEQLDVLFPDSSKQQFIELTEKEFLNRTHFSTGMWIRNEWLYKRFLGFNLGESDLRNNLASKGLSTNDDMSTVILTSFYRYIKKEDLNVELQIRNIHQYYKNMNDPVWVKKQQEVWWAENMAKYSIGDTLTNQVYYNRNWLGMPKKNSMVTAIIEEKSERQLKIQIISIGQEHDKIKIFEEISCKEESCWVNPFEWQLNK